MKNPKKITRAWLSRWVLRMAPQVKTKSPRWFIHNAGGEEGTFCFDCGETRRLELIKECQDKPDELQNLDRLDGGWSQESDSCVHCEKCGQLLDYTLTNYGAESEWEHFLEHGIDASDPDQSYHIEAILNHGMPLRGISKLKLL